ncbi:MAG: uroporphyrinogen-III C-methyltransferase [Ruminococcus sp.]|nr:uroporphyrinogen-III C-methyltransferase [Ruminococcus sp.]
MSKYGKVYLVGAGCGDYDLITLRGKSLLENCDTVVYDSLIDKALLDYAPDAEHICVGKRAGKHSETQESINKILIDKAKDGKTVVRLKGGDPFVFGRGGEEVLALQSEKIEYSVVPGISSSIAVPELAGIPVTHRKTSRSVHIITGNTADEVLPKNMNTYARLDGTLVFLMGLNKLSQISDSLIEHGKSENTPTAIISNGASTHQRIVKSTLKNIYKDVQREKIKSPAVIVVGEVADFDFSETVFKPLRDVSVTVTGTKKFADKLSLQLKNYGAKLKTLDYLRVKDCSDSNEFYSAFNNLSNYSWLVFTSTNGVVIFIKRLQKLKFDVRKLANLKIATVGKGTAKALEKYGLYADLIPDEYTAINLAKTLVKTVKQDDNLLILRAKSGSIELNKILDEHKINYADIKTYEVENLPINTDDKTVDTDFITFASSSGVKHFFENNIRISPKTKIVCIGEPTAKALSANGVENYLVAKNGSAKGIVDLIIQEAEREKIQTT